MPRFAPLPTHVFTALFEASLMCFGVFLTPPMLPFSWYKDLGRAIWVCTRWMSQDGFLCTSLMLLAHTSSLCFLVLCRMSSAWDQTVLGLGIKKGRWSRGFWFQMPVFQFGETKQRKWTGSHRRLTSEPVLTLLALDGQSRCSGLWRHVWGGDAGNQRFLLLSLYMSSP